MMSKNGFQKNNNSTSEKERSLRYLPLSGPHILRVCGGPRSLISYAHPIFGRAETSENMCSSWWKNMVVVGVSLTMAACSSTNTEFDCPASGGVGCVSISKVNAMMDKGAFGDPLEETEQRLGTMGPSLKDGDRLAGSRVLILDFVDQDGTTQPAHFMEMDDVR